MAGGAALDRTLAGATRAVDEESTLRRLARSELARVVLLIVAWKLLTFGVGYLGFSFVPYDTIQHEFGFNYPETDGISYRSALTTWDAAHYLYLADQGYGPDDPSNWFAPLYPLTISGVDQVVGDVIVSGLLVANLASTAGLGLFFAFVRRHFGAPVAWRALLLLIAFPTAFFLNLIYTEALFLLLVMLFLWFLYERQLPLAAAAAFLLPLTRPVGFAVIVPFAVFVLLDGLKEPLASAIRSDPAGWLRRSGPRLLYLLGPVAGLLAYFLYMHLAAGDAFAAWKTQAGYVSDWSLAHAVNPLHLIDNLVGQKLRLHGDLNSALDRIFFLGFLASLALIYRRTDRTLFTFALIMGMTPLLGSFMSYLRYLLLALPLFVAYGARLDERGGALTRRLLTAMFTAQVGFIAFQFADHWVA